MSKRELFEELKTSLQDAKTYEEGKLTLKNVTLKKREQKILTADEIRNIRKKYNMSRAIFANFLHISPRTLEKWELGTSKPNTQASTLLALTDKYPDMFDRLETV